jgi:hypothetical protein
MQKSGAYIQRRYQPADVALPPTRAAVPPLLKHLAWRTLHLRSRGDLAQLIWQAGWSYGWIEALLRMRGRLPGAPDARV